jgi:hypothetical protein
MKRSTIGSKPMDKDGIMANVFDLYKLLKVAIEIFCSLFDKLLIRGGTKNIFLRKTRELFFGIMVFQLRV